MRILILLAAALGVLAAPAARADIIGFEIHYSPASDAGDRNCRGKYPADDTFGVARKNIVNGSCWACPKGYDRTLQPSPRNDKACKVDAYWRYRLADKSSIEPSKVLKNCKGKDVFYEEGSCWTCPSGWKRSPLRNDGKGQASCKLRVDAVYSAATDRGEPGCPEGAWSPIGSRSCFTCPPGYKRKLLRVSRDRTEDEKACYRWTWSPEKAAKFVEEKKDEVGQLKEKYADTIAALKTLADSMKDRKDEILAYAGLRDGIAPITGATVRTAGGTQVFDAVETDTEDDVPMSLSLVVEGDGSAALGANFSAGGAFAPSAGSSPLMTLNGSVGLSAGLDGAVIASVWFRPHDQLGGEAHGLVLAGALGEGMNLSFWWDPNWGRKDDFIGISVGPQVGLDAEIEYNFGYSWQ